MINSNKAEDYKILSFETDVKVLDNSDNNIIKFKKEEESEKNKKGLQNL